MKEDYYKLKYSGATIDSILDKVFPTISAGALITTDDTADWITVADDQTIEGQKTFLSPVLIDNGETSYNKRYTSFSPLEWKMHSNEGNSDLVTITPGSLKIVRERLPHFFEIAINSSDRVAHITHGTGTQYTATLPEKTGTLAMTDDLYDEINILLGSTTTGQDPYTSAQYIRFTPLTDQANILMDETKNLIKVNLSNVPDAPARYIWFKRNTTVQESLDNVDYTAYQFSAGGEQFWYDNFPTDVAVKDIGNAAMVYVPVSTMSTGYCYITYASISLPDLYAALGKVANLNIENGTGTNAIKQKMVDATVNFTGRNPNAESLDNTLSATINTGASGSQSSAFGKNTMALATASFTNGNKTLAKGEESHAEGYQSVTLGNGSHAEGTATTAYAEASHSEGSGTVAYGLYSHSEGVNNWSKGESSHAEGDNNESNGYGSHVEGAYTYTGDEENIPSSRPEDTSGGGSGGSGGDGGSSTVNKQGNGAHAEGFYTVAVGNYSHSEGYVSDAIGLGSHAEGGWNTASGELSHAEGKHNTASGYCSHVAGLYNTAGNAYQTVIGRYNLNKTNTVFEIGWGESESNRENIFEVYQDGHAEIGLMGSTANSIATKGYVDSNASTQLYEHNIILSIDNFSPGTGSSYCISLRLINTTSTPYASGLALFTALYNAGYQTSTSFITASGSCVVGTTAGTPLYTGNVIGLYCTGSTTYATLMYVTTGTLSGTDFTITNKISSFDTSTCSGPNTMPTVIDFVRALN